MIRGTKMRGNKGGGGWLHRVRRAATGLHNPVGGIVLMFWCALQCSEQYWDAFEQY